MFLPSRGLVLALSLVAQCRGAPTRSQESGATKASKQLSHRQNSPAINPADNVWPQASGGPIVLDLPDAPGAPLPPLASGSPFGSSSLVGFIGVTPSGDARVPDPSLIPAQSADAKEGLILDFQTVPTPQPIRGTTGKTGGTDDEALDTRPYDRLHPDIFAPPGTDSGDVDNAQWPMGLSHNRGGLKGAGWARQQNIDVLPRALSMAGVDMRLSPHAYRELHWHQAGEWSYILNGTLRVAVVNENGETFVDDLGTGDLWFFPPGVPHSIQAFENGCEFLLVFDDGHFSEEGTSLVSEMFLRNPLEVLAKDLQTDISSFKDMPTDQLYIFEGTPAPKNISEQNVTGPAGATSSMLTQYTYHFSQQEPMVIPGAGSLKIADPTSFPAAADVSAGLVTIEPGAMRELHWHLDSDEWLFIIQGSARATLYSPPSSSRTFDFTSGDVGYIPMTFSHYIENTGDEDLIVLEMLKAPKFTDISASQWLGLTPRQIVKDTLNLSDSVLDNLPKYKPILVPGSKDHLQTNFTRPF